MVFKQDLAITTTTSVMNTTISSVTDFCCSVHTVACIETRRLGNLPYKPGISK